MGHGFLISGALNKLLQPTYNCISLRRWNSLQFIHWLLCFSSSHTLLGVDDNLISKIQGPYNQNQVAQTYQDVTKSIKDFGPWSGAWVGESSGAYNSGGNSPVRVHSLPSRIYMIPTWQSEVDACFTLIGWIPVLHMFVHLCLKLMLEWLPGVNPTVTSTLPN
ncbi:hypothetical protein FNV43_RR08838 [Rhamnella rubrinervis]|uniref:Uncharacterized protein n=1 Tax=Rhamnella rubrinervis TaxID=2594499 RepID=A0A8K0H8Y0_9ROSA|nr:hypothetical protein FNV43_RR08838 [Rhamnella rubrinervis]